MKKSLVFIMLLLSAGSAFSQHYIGVKGAAGINNIDAVPKLDTKSLTTFNPGILYRYEHKKYAAIQIELNYINKGYIQAVDTVMNTPETYQRISSVELPVMAQGFIRLGAFRPYVTGGATIGYILGRTTQITGEEKTDYAFGEYDRRFEYGIAGGAGLGVRVSVFELQAEWRYHYDFSFLHDPVIPGGSTQSLNTTRMMISLSLLYRLGK